MSHNQAKERVAIILHSGSYDRASYALSLAVTALALEMEVHILLTWGALKRFSQGHLEELGPETSDEFRDHLERGLQSGGITPLTEQLADAKRFGLKLYACTGAMANLNIIRDELVPDVDQVMGLVTFLELARSATINWYI